MPMIKRSEPQFMTATQAAQRQGYAARAELKMREVLEQFCRQRWPGARVCHEMVMFEGKVRADMVAFGTDHIAALEIKGPWDDTTRLLHQVGMFQLAVPEVWMVVTERQAEDARLVRYLIPSIGLIQIPGIGRSGFVDDIEAIRIEVLAEAGPRVPHAYALLNMLWRDELASACAHHQVPTGSRASRPKLIQSLLDHLEPGELVPAACRELCGREALWRADPAIRAK